MLGHIRPYSISVKTKDKYSLLLIHHSIYEEVCRSWKIKTQSDPQNSFSFWWLNCDVSEHKMSTSTVFCDFRRCADWFIQRYQTWHHIPEVYNINNQGWRAWDFMSSYLHTNIHIFNRVAVEAHHALPCILHCLPTDTWLSMNLITTTFNCLQKDSLSQNTVIKNS